MEADFLTKQTSMLLIQVLIFGLNVCENGLHLNIEFCLSQSAGFFSHVSDMGIKTVFDMRAPFTW